MMSINGICEGENGNDSHPILRVQNLKKPQLEKLNHHSNLSDGKMSFILNQNSTITNDEYRADYPSVLD